MRQLQAEVRKLKEQLAQALAVGEHRHCGRDPAPGGPSVLMGKAKLFNYITNGNNAFFKILFICFNKNKLSVYLFTLQFFPFLSCFSKLISRYIYGQST